KVAGFNSVFYGALRFVEELARKQGDNGKADEYKVAGAKLQKSFNEKMLNPKFPGGEIAPYFDVIEGDPHKGALRSDMVWLVSRGRDLIPEEMRVAVVMTATKHLLSPYGMRTLAPQDSNSKGDYRSRQDTGNQAYTDEAYHQGTVWPWQIVDYLDAVARVWNLEAFRRHRKEFLRLIRRIYGEASFPREDHSVTLQDVAAAVLTPLLAFLKNNWAKSLPEVFDGGNREDILAGRPYHQEPGGTPSQSWSIASVIEAGVRYGVFDAKILRWWSEASARPYGVFVEPFSEKEPLKPIETIETVKLETGQAHTVRVRVYIREGIAPNSLDVELRMPRKPLEDWGKDWQDIRSVSLTPVKRSDNNVYILYEGILPTEGLAPGKYEFVVHAVRRENRSEAWSGNVRIEIAVKPAAEPKATEPVAVETKSAAEFQAEAMRSEARDLKRMIQQPADWSAVAANILVTWAEQGKILGQQAGRLASAMTEHFDSVVLAFEQIGPELAPVYAYHRLRNDGASLGDYQMHEEMLSGFVVRNLKAMEAVMKKYLETHDEAEGLHFNLIIPFSSNPDIQRWWVGFLKKIRAVSSLPGHQDRISADIRFLATTEEIRRFTDFFDTVRSTGMAEEIVLDQAAPKAVNSFLGRFQNAMIFAPPPELIRQVSMTEQHRLVGLEGLIWEQAFPVSMVIGFNAAMVNEITADMLRQIPAFFHEGMVTYNGSGLVVNAIARELILRASVSELISQMA
ncbi:MAG: hypothetical protein NC930_01605, partial [Candidatus Omnitrophica bacterium]|nr:hypothetical protein [Candidatus Omnitrophota bacterium]